MGTHRTLCWYTFLAFNVFNDYRAQLLSMYTPSMVQTTKTKLTVFFFDSVLLFGKVETCCRRM